MVALDEGREVSNFHRTVPQPAPVHLSRGPTPKPTPHRQCLSTDSLCVGSQMTSKAHVVLRMTLWTGMLSKGILGA